jgi:hypothetical protein
MTATNFDELPLEGGSLSVASSLDGCCINFAGRPWQMVRKCEMVVLV